MQLTYEQFINTVPRETVEFVNVLLPLLDYYKSKENYVYFKFTSNDSAKSYDEKVFYLSLYAMCKNKEYEIFLSNCGFQSDSIDLRNCGIYTDYSEADFSNMFAKNGYIFNIFADELDYLTLYPMDIVINNLKRLTKNNLNSEQKDLFLKFLPRMQNTGILKNILIDYNKKKKDILEQELEQEIYDQLPISVISYLETASKIRKIILNELKDNDSEIIKINDIIPLSLFLSLYYYKDTLMFQDINISEQQLIKRFLKDNKININQIYEQLDLDLQNYTIEETKKNLVCIKNLYERYFKLGSCENINSKDITVSKIIENVFNREFTNSFIIEKLLAKINHNISIFDSFEDKINDMIKAEVKKYYNNYVKEIYSKLNKDSKEFIEFAAKIYILILKKMKPNQHNQKLLVDKNDADTLSLLIASYYYNGDVSNFFLDYKITLEKILKLLNIKLNKDEIENTKLDKKVLVQTFKKFIYEGVNKNKDSVEINDIINNICDAEFNKSSIMEGVFEELTDKLDLNENFLNQLKKHIKDKEQTRINTLYQNLFYDMPLETIDFLEKTSYIHNYIKERPNKFDKNDIKVVSMLFALVFCDDSKMKEFIETRGFTEDEIKSYLGLMYTKLTFSSPGDIDLLTNEYGEYIFGGYNKGKERKDLTILDITKNIFSKELNNSVTFSKFLSHFDKNYEELENLEETYMKYLENKKHQENQIKGQSVVYFFDDATKAYINKVLKIHSSIKEQTDEDYDSIDIISSDDDIIKISMILGLYFANNNVAKFFEKNNITADNILSMCKLQLDNKKINNSNIEPDYTLVLDEYLNYLNDFTLKTEDIIKKLFKLDNDEFIKEICERLNVDYEVLKREVETGKDYELSLTIDERISILENKDIDSLNIDDINSILHFGESLATHSKYIHDELPRLMLSDIHDSSVDTINNIINRVYVKEKVTTKKPGFFARIFAVSVEEEKTKMVLNTSAISELKTAIDTNVTTLSQELLAYDAIRKYIETYAKKNRKHYLISDEMAKKTEEKLALLDPNNPDEYSLYLSTSSKLQILNNKVNRFLTTSQLLNQELFKVNQAIVNHFITINALEMAKNDLIPLIGSELAIAKGRESENQALDLSHNVIKLFQSILSRNVDGTIENIEQLKKANISSEVFNLLNEDIKRYLEELTTVQSMSSKLEVQTEELKSIESKSNKTKNLKI